MINDHHYSYSNLNNYASCPLQFRYTNELHLVSIQADQFHMNYGAALHAGLSSWYKDRDIEKAKTAFLDRAPADDPSNLAKTRKHGAFTIEQYAKEYADDFRRWEILSNEQTDLMDDGYGVTLDMVVKDKATGQIWGIDHKSTGRYLNADYWGQFDPNSQITQYFQFIKARYGWCDSFMVNAIAMRFRQRASKDGPAGFWCKFERQLFNRSPTQISQDTESRDDWIKDIERARETGVWRMNTGACWRCSYKAVCSAGWDWEHDSDLILTNFKQVCAQKIPITNERCTLELNHAGDCQWSMAQSEETEFQVVV